MTLLGDYSIASCSLAERGGADGSGHSAHEEQRSELAGVTRIGPLDYIIPTIERGLSEVNLGRTLQRESRPASSTTHRVAAILPEVWAAHPAGETCDVYRGRHEHECPHRRPSILVTRSAIARAVFGYRPNGRQLEQVAAAISELADERIEFDAVDPEYGVTFRYRGHAISYGVLATADRGPHGEELYAIAFDSMLHTSMLAGHVQRIPLQLVQRLGGRRDFRLWLAILSQPRVARLRVNESAEFGLTGRNPAIDVSRLGLPNRADRLRAAVERAVERGNEIQDEWRIEVLRRAGGGVKVRVRRLRNRPTVRSTSSDGSSHTVRRFDPIRPTVRSTNRAQSGTCRPSGDSYVDLEETRARDARDSLSSSSSKSGSGQRTRTSKRGSRPDVDALRRAGVRVSKKMIPTLDEIADRQAGTDGIADGRVWIAKTVEEASDLGVEDAFRYVCDVDSRLSAERGAAEDRRVREAEAAKAADKAAAAARKAEIEEKAGVPLTIGHNGNGHMFDADKRRRYIDQLRGLRGLTEPGIFAEMLARHGIEEHELEREPEAVS